MVLMAGQKDISTTPSMINCNNNIADLLPAPHIRVSLGNFFDWIFSVDNGFKASFFNEVLDMIQTPDQVSGNWKYHFPSTGSWGEEGYQDVHCPA